MTCGPESHKVHYHETCLALGALESSLLRMQLSVTPRLESCLAVRTVTYGNPNLAESRDEVTGWFCSVDELSVTAANTGDVTHDGGLANTDNLMDSDSAPLSLSLAAGPRTSSSSLRLSHPPESVTVLVSERHTVEVRVNSTWHKVLLIHW